MIFSCWFFFPPLVYVLLVYCDCDDSCYYCCSIWFLSDIFCLFYQWCCLSYLVAIGALLFAAIFLADWCAWCCLLVTVFITGIFLCHFMLLLFFFLLMSTSPCWFTACVLLFNCFLLMLFWNVIILTIDSSINAISHHW